MQLMQLMPMHCIKPNSRDSGFTTSRLPFDTVREGKHMHRGVCLHLRCARLSVRLTFCSDVKLGHVIDAALGACSPYCCRVRLCSNRHSHIEPVANHQHIYA